MQDDFNEQYMTANETSTALTRIELAMIRAVEAFNRWAVTLHKSVSTSVLGAHDLYLLHSIRTRGGLQNRAAQD